ncbi:MAG: hypothetical protein AAF902_23340, partial [Chloroflexota bacterium]
LPDPDDAEGYLTSIVSEELFGLLDEADIGRNANIDRIGEWLEMRGISGIKIDGKISLSHDQILKILEFGYINVLKNSEDYGINKQLLGQLNKAQKSLHKKGLTYQFTGPIIDGEGAENLDEHFANLTSMRAMYEGATPTLSLGTILKKQNVTNGQDKESGDNQYYICLQPRCDCVRVNQPRQFPFLPLTENEGVFDFVIKEENNFLKLKCSRKPFDLKLLEFNGVKSGGKVTSQSLRNGDYVFIDEIGETYTWIGELRGEQSLRISSQFATTMSRIGLDEYEWLRLHSIRR